MYQLWNTTSPEAEVRIGFLKRPSARPILEGETSETHGLQIEIPTWGKYVNISPRCPSLTRENIFRGLYCHVPCPLISPMIRHRPKPTDTINGLRIRWWIWADHRILTGPPDGPMLRILNLHREFARRLVCSKQM